MLEIKSFLTPYMQSFCYIVSEGKSAIILDPCELSEIDVYMKENEKHLDYCILTHEHFDHISGLEWIHDMKVPVIASKKCNDNLADVRKNQSRYFETFSMLQDRLKGLPIPHVEEYRGFADIMFSFEKTIQWNSHKVFLKETPGHSEGSICILIDDSYMFSGDTIFRDYDTNTNVPGANEEDLKEKTIPWIESLQSDIIVYPGHYESFKLNEWRKRHDTINL